MPNTTVKKFQKELIESILKESRHFDMGQFTKRSKRSKPGQRFDYTAPAKCGTASCIAGHIEALRPALAKKFHKELAHNTDIASLGVNQDGSPSHEVIAAAIWEHETGKECLFDFFGRNNRLSNGDYVGLRHITREDAIEHIKGTHPLWPQLHAGQ